MRVLMLTPVVDADSRLQTGFTHFWIESLASRAEHVTVLCRATGTIALPDNVTVIDLKGGRSRSNVRFLWSCFRSVRRQIGRTDVVFTHLRPRYTLVAWPAARLRNVPLVYWNANASTDEAMEVWLAHHCADRIVTSTPESYKYSNGKVSIIGHGVDFARFVPGGGPRPGVRKVVAAGRLSPVKNFEAQVDAAALLLARPGFDDVTFYVAGDEGWWSAGYRSKLDDYISQRGLTERFRLLGGVPYSKIVALYQDATVALSTSRTGSLDKVVLEAMGCGLPVLVTGTVYNPLLAEDQRLLKAREDDPQDLADRLASLLTMNPENRRALGSRLRRRAMEAHSLDRLMDRLVSIFQDESVHRRHQRSG